MYPSYRIYENSVIFMSFDSLSPIQLLFPLECFKANLRAFYHFASLVAQMVKNLHAMQETGV